MGVRLRRVGGGVIAGAVGLALLATGPAGAQSCFSMQAELLQLQARGDGNDGGRYERAYREQANVIARTEMRARRAGCFGTGFFLFRQAPDPSCNALIPKLREMQDNLVRLDHLRRRSGGARNDFRVRELQGMMAARGCDLPRGRLFERRSDEDSRYEPDPYRSGSGGTYRTLCVRTCDGYYFPISFSTTSERFADDARTCQAMCPGAEARLFYHDNPGGGPENMISVTGEPYTSLPTAFRYRESIDPTCTCKPAGGYAAAPQQSQPSGVGAAAVDLTAPIPLPRPEPGEDPETLADRAGSFVPRPPSEADTAGTPVATNASGQSVRVVGPALGNAAQDALVIAPVPN